MDAQEMLIEMRNRLVENPETSSLLDQVLAHVRDAADLVNVNPYSREFILGVGAASGVLLRVLNESEQFTEDQTATVFTAAALLDVVSRGLADARKKA